MLLTPGKFCKSVLRTMFIFSFGLAFYGIAHADEHGYRGHEFRESEFRQHEFLDSRYHHNHYYPPRGYEFAVLPRAYRAVVYRGTQYYFGAGVWYRHVGVNFVVVAPPIGIVVPILPPFYTTLWVGNVPYYYANNVYYTPAPQGYAVVQEPTSKVVVEQQPATAAVQQPGNVVELGPAGGPANPQPQGVAAAPSTSGQIFIYPNKGQSQAEQAKDRNDCHGWAVSQTGYDPLLQTGGNTGAQTNTNLVDYQRALGACLEGRGYTVR